MGRTWLSPCKARIMSPTEAAWLAGFFDGEGTLCQYPAGRNKKPAWRMQTVNTNRDSVVRCYEYTLSGNVHPRVKPGTPAHHLPQWSWHVTAQRDLVSICQQIVPFTIIKVGVINQFLSSWRDIQRL